MFLSLPFPPSYSLRYSFSNTRYCSGGYENEELNFCVDVGGKIDTVLRVQKLVYSYRYR